MPIFFFSNTNEIFDQILVHYRFDSNDWMNHCDGKEDNLTCERVVEVMHDVPKALENFADYVERQVKFNQKYFLSKDVEKLFFCDIYFSFLKVMVAGIEAVYLAVPLSEAEVRSGMKVVLQDRSVESKLYEIYNKS